MPPIRRLAAIMFSDVVGYTAMMQRDESDAVARVRRYREVLAERVSHHHGEILQHYGDGTLSIFPSAVEAAACAREVQLALQQPPQVPLRIGLHIGDVVREGDDLYGDGVNLASRIQSLAPPGAILFTERVMEDIRSHPELRGVALGKFAFKNVAHPLKVYALAGPGFPALRRSELHSLKGDAIVWEAGRITRRHLNFLWPALLALAVMVGLTWFAFRPTATSILPVASATSQPSVAVLPFQDFSPSRDQAYFSEGIAEEILNALTQVEGLKVAGRTSSFAFRDGKTDVREIGQYLGVDAVLEGSVRKSGNQVRVTAQLINTQDGFHLWSQTYDRQLDDIFNVQQDIARAVTDKLAGLLLPQSIAKAPNQAAYEAYLRGKYLVSQRADGAQEAIQFFERSIALDSAFAPAYAGLANAYLWLGWNNYLPSQEAFPQAQRYATRALQLDPQLAYGYALLGAVQLWYDWDWAAARATLHEAVRRNPSEARAYLDLGWLQAVTGSLDSALASMQKAIDLDPLNLEYNLDQADIYRMSQRWADASSRVTAMRQRYPDNSEVPWMAGLIAYNQHNYQAALPAFAQAVTLSQGEAWAKLHQLMALAKTGQTADARRQLEELLTLEPLTQNAPVELAMAYLALNDRHAALTQLEAAYGLRANWLISLPIDPVWDPLRHEPRFQQLLQKMGLPR